MPNFAFFSRLSRAGFCAAKASIYGVIELLAVDYQLEIRIDRPADLDRVVEFFERSAYAPEPVDARTIALTPPEAVDLALARRELELYLRILERVHPGVAATLAA
jgi:hypothetical protein